LHLGKGKTKEAVKGAGVTKGLEEEVRRIRGAQGV
jgi:hypothetical protein